MNAVALVSVLIVQAVPSAVEHPLPLAAAKPVLEYTTCLLEPLGAKLKTGLPKLRSEREKIVAAQLAECVAARKDAQREALSAVSAAAEKAEVDRALAAADNQLRFIVVDHEKFVAESDAFCRERGEEPGC